MHCHFTPLQHRHLLPLQELLLGVSCKIRKAVWLNTSECTNIFMSSQNKSNYLRRKDSCNVPYGQKMTGVLWPGFDAFSTQPLPRVLKAPWSHCFPNFVALGAVLSGHHHLVSLQPERHICSFTLLGSCMLLWHCSWHQCGKMKN